MENLKINKEYDSLNKEYERLFNFIETSNLDKKTEDQLYSSLRVIENGLKFINSFINKQ